MITTIKNFILVVLIYILSLCFASAQQNSSPIICRITTTTVNRTGVGTGQFIVNNALTGGELNEMPLPIASVNFELSHNKTKAYIPARLVINSTGLGAILVSFNQNDSNIITTFLQNKGILRLRLCPASDGLLWALAALDNQVLLVDPDSLKTVGQIDNVQFPVDIVFSPDGTKAYIALLDNSISVFDTKAFTLLKTITGLPSNSNFIEKAHEMAISLDGKMLAIGSKNIVSLIDTSSYSITNITIPVQFANQIDNEELKLVFNPNNNILYIAEFGGVNLYSYNISTKELKNIFTVDLNNRPTVFPISSLTITEDGKVLYLCCGGGRVLIDTSRNSAIATFIDMGSTAVQGFADIALAGDFNIGQAPSLQTTMPTANQQVAANQAYNITWQTTVMPQSFSIANHKIELSTDGGQTFNVIPGAEQLKPDAQNFIWNVPDIEVSKAQIRVSTVDLGARRASSTTGNFSITKNSNVGDTQPPTVNFLSPKGGEKFNSGDTLQITWTSSDNVGVTSQDLSLSTDGGSTFPITLASGLSGATQQFTYQIPMSLQSDQTRLKLVVRDSAENSAQAVTANNFSISLGADTVKPTVVISQPTSSQSIVAGAPIQVKWQSTDNRGVVGQALLLSFDNGKTFSQIASLGASDNSFVLNNIDKLSFTTPQAVVKITATDATGNKGEANSLFTIAPAIAMASYQAKVLSIMGIGFMSNVNNTIRLFVNDKEVSLSPSSVSNVTVTIKGNKKKLNITKGSNTVKIIVDGIGSNTFPFQF